MSEAWRSPAVGQTPGGGSKAGGRHSEQMYLGLGIVWQREGNQTPASSTGRDGWCAPVLSLHLECWPGHGPLTQPSGGPGDNPRLTGQRAAALCGEQRAGPGHLEMKVREHIALCSSVYCLWSWEVLTGMRVRNNHRLWVLLETCAPPKVSGRPPLAFRTQC